MKKVIVTGGNGFIGSNLIKYLLSKRYFVVNIDKNKYSNGSYLLKKNTNKNYRFFRLDINNNKILKILTKYKPHAIFNLAAETHVDRSIETPKDFIHSNILGTFNILEQIRNYKKKNRNNLRLIHISTDEVYGDLKNSKKLFKETNKFDPSSPYSASKASSDHLVNSWFKTYGIPAIITNCSNNFGSYQHPEKLIPHMIISAIKGKKLPIYGSGLQIRDWIYVEDHISALLKISEKGKIGETYNIGSNNQIRNINIVKKICFYLDKHYKKKDNDSFLNLISFVKDRPAHDTRYAIDNKKIKKHVDWKPSKNFDKLLNKTIKWYLQNTQWWEKILSKNYKIKRIGLKND